MDIRIPTHVFVYAAGIIGVIVIVLIISGSIALVDRYITRKRLEKAARDE